MAVTPRRRGSARVADEGGPREESTHHTTTKAAQRVMLCTYHGSTRKLEGEGEHGGAASSPNPNPRF